MQSTQNALATAKPILRDRSATKGEAFHKLTAREVKKNWLKGLYTAESYLYHLMKSLRADGWWLYVQNVSQFCQEWRISRNAFYTGKSKLIAKGLLVVKEGSRLSMSIPHTNDLDTDDLDTDDLDTEKSGTVPVPSIDKSPPESGAKVPSLDREICPRFRTILSSNSGSCPPLKVPVYEPKDTMHLQNESQHTFHDSTDLNTNNTDLNTTTETEQPTHHPVVDNSDFYSFCLNANREEQDSYREQLTQISDREIEKNQTDLSQTNFTHQTQAQVIDHPSNSIQTGEDNFSAAAVNDMNSQQASEAPSPKPAKPVLLKQPATIDPFPAATATNKVLDEAAAAIAPVPLNFHLRRAVIDAIAQHGDRVVRDAISVVKENVDGGKVKNPAGMLRVAMTKPQDWQPVKRKAPANFVAWFEKARALGVVLASQLNKLTGIIEIFTSDRQWTTFEEISAQYSMETLDAIAIIQQDLAPS